MPLSIADGALPWQRLAVLHKHPRDDQIQFDEPTHTYTIDGVREGWVSCTTFIHKFFPPFDADAIIDKMMNSNKWPQSKYFGITREEIKKQWDDKRDAASTAGTRMHLDIEHFYNALHAGGMEDADGWDANASSEWNYFQSYQCKIGHKMTAHRTEWLIFDEDVKIAGSVDMVYKKQDGTYAIYDWKRAAKIEYENRWQTMLPPLQHLPDTNYWHYSLQLNVYRTILEKQYDITVSELALVVLHPDNTGFKVIKCNIMPDEIEMMMDHRKANLHNP